MMGYFKRLWLLVTNSLTASGVIIDVEKVVTVPGQLVIIDDNQIKKNGEP
jgi:hypothetical protein